MNDIISDSEYEYSRAQIIQHEATDKNFNSQFKSAQLMQAETLDRKKEYIVNNVQSCVDNGKILYKVCTDAATLKNSEMCEITYRDSGFLDDRSICSTLTSALKKAKIQDIESNQRF